MSFGNIPKMLLAIQREVDETQVHHRILRQLVFNDMNSRANQIHKAAQDTYSWILEDGPVNRKDQRTHAWHIFLKWLRVGDNILHVSGNPGSGKSTLVKFLVQHDRTKEELRVWAGANTLVFCVFYFWNTGSEAQRSLSGLYRSLLFQSLSQCPELIREVFPLQFRRMSAFTEDTKVEELQSFGEDHIKEAFNLLLDRACQRGYRLCFFIDGLDECEGNRLRHEELALMLQSWTGSGSIKLCVSSRPYPEFIEPLDITDNQLVQLHDLNEYGIRAYCFERFQNDVHARKRGRLCHELAQTVVKEAQGVFLWVYLVIDILLMGFRQADPDSVLWAQLNALPRDLDLLYTKLREPIEADNIQRDRSNRMLLLAARNPNRSSLTAMAFSWLEELGCDQGGLMNPDFPQPTGMKPYSEEEVSKRVEHVTMQINGLARGFLEVRPRNSPRGEGEIDSFFESTVQFCHRTARDYLLQNKDRQHALLNSFPNFEKSGVYTRILLAETIHGYDSKIPYETNIFFRACRSVQNGIDHNLVGRFELPVRDLIIPLSIFYPSGTRNFWDHELDQVSFTEYAAYCGLSHYVLREVATDAAKLKGTTARGNVLLAALKNQQNDLAFELLRLSRGQTQLCVVWDVHGKVQSLAPTCVIAVAEVLQQIIGNLNGSPFILLSLHSEKDLDLCKKILRFSISMKVSMQITIRGVEIQYDDSQRDYSDGLQVQVDIPDVLQMLESFTVPGGEKIHDGAQLWWEDFGRSKLEMSIARLGQVVEKGADEMHGLKEWPDQPNHVFTHGTRHRELFVERIEWALDDQDLVELKGWVRVY